MIWICFQSFHLKWVSFQWVTISASSLSKTHIHGKSPTRTLLWHGSFVPSVWPRFTRSFTVLRWSCWGDLRIWRVAGDRQWSLYHWYLSKGESYILYLFEFNWLIGLMGFLSFSFRTQRTQYGPFRQFLRCHLYPQIQPDLGLEVGGRIWLCLHISHLEVQVWIKKNKKDQRETHTPSSSWSLVCWGTLIWP